MGVFCFSPAQRDKNDPSADRAERGERGWGGRRAGAASAKHALSFGAQSALVPNGLHKACFMGRPPLRPEVGPSRASAPHRVCCGCCILEIRDKLEGGTILSETLAICGACRCPGVMSSNAVSIPEAHCLSTTTQWSAVELGSKQRMYFETEHVFESTKLRYSKLSAWTAISTKHYAPFRTVITAGFSLERHRSLHRKIPGCRLIPDRA